MSMLSISEGWTARLGPFTLKVDGVVIDLTSLTVTLQLRTSKGAIVVPGGVVTVTVPAAGLVVYDPVAADFVAANSPYRMHFKVVDTLGKVAFFPNGRPEEIVVYLN